MASAVSQSLESGRKRIDSALNLDISTGHGIWLRS